MQVFAQVSCFEHFLQIELLQELGIAPRTVRLRVSDHQLPWLYHRAEAFVFPSQYEGFGLAALEALAAGVPVVARDLPVLREVFGRAARFGTDAPDFARQMQHAATQPDPPRRAAGQALAPSLTWQAAAHQHLKLYRSLAP